MQFQIEVINVQSTTKPTKTGSYTMLDVAFKRLDTGKIEGKKIVSFTNKEIFNLMSKAVNGNQFTITSEKNEQTTYWEWTAVVPGAGGGSEAPSSAPTAAKTGFASPKSTYETSEERAARQVLIVRQSSLSNAIDLLKVDKKAVDAGEALQVAELFANWVFQKGETVGEDTNFADMADDIPM